MNNSFPRLIDGMCATLRHEVLARIDDEYARSQVYGVINALNTFKVRADWSAGYLLQQIEAQRQALAAAAQLLAALPASAAAPPVDVPDRPHATPIADLLALRDRANRSIGGLLQWLAAQDGPAAPVSIDVAAVIQPIERILRDAMRAEVETELQHAPRPLFAEMSGGG